MSPPNGGPLSVFAERQYRWLLAGDATFFFAMNGQMLTRSILAWNLTGEAMGLAYINLVVAIPMLLASLLGGAITDRIERRQIVVLGQALLAANEIVILSLLLLGKLAFWHLMVTGFITGCVMPFIMPARVAMVATVVGPRRIQTAMAWSGGVMNLSRVAGPAVMGLVIGRFSMSAAYGLAAALYISATCFMLGVGASRAAVTGAPRKSLLADIWQGVSYVKDNRTLLLCMLFGLLPILVAMPFQNLLVMLVEQSWQKGETAVGTLTAIAGMGGVIGSMWIVRRGDNPHRLVFMISATVGFAVFLALFAQTPNFYLAMVPLLIANTCAASGQTLSSSAVQIMVDDEVRGRISSLMMMSFSLMPVGVFPMAMAADRYGAVAAISGACAVLLVIIALFVSLSPSFRKLDSVVNSRLAAAEASEAETGISPEGEGLSVR